MSKKANIEIEEKYLYVDSYSTTESKGLGFVDSIIGTVLDLNKTAKDNYHIVGYEQGRIFSTKDSNKIKMGELKLYILHDAETGRCYCDEIYAANLDVLKLILNHLFIAGAKLNVYEIQQPEFVKTIEVKK